MATAILKFNLDDPDDRMAHLRCLKAEEMALAIWEFMGNTRRTLERKTEYTPEKSVYDGVSIVFDKFQELLEERGINIDELTW